MDVHRQDFQKGGVQARSRSYSQSDCSDSPPSTLNRQVSSASTAFHKSTKKGAIPPLETSHSFDEDPLLMSSYTPPVIHHHHHHKVGGGGNQYDEVLFRNGVHHHNSSGSTSPLLDNMDKDSDVFSMAGSYNGVIGNGTTNQGDTRREKRRRRSLGILAAVLYGSTSAGMAFANKAILTFYEFNYSYFLMFCQVSVSIFVLETLRHLKLTKLPRYSMERGRIFLVASMLYAIYSVLALSSLSKMSIAMYDVIRRCGPLATLLVSWLILKTDKPNTPVSTSILLITAGCIIAGYGDLTFDLTAYTHGAVSDFAQALCLVMIQRTAEKKGFSATETLHINSLNALPLLCFCSAWSGEFSRAAQQFGSKDVKFMLIFIIVISSGCILNFFLFLCTTLNSALTTSVVGTVKSVVQTFVGTLFFGGLSINLFTITGVAVNFAGTFLYTCAKYRDARRTHRLSSASKEEIRDI